MFKDFGHITKKYQAAKDAGFTAVECNSIFEVRRQIDKNMNLFQVSDSVLIKARIMIRYVVV